MKFHSPPTEYEVRLNERSTALTGSRLTFSKRTPAFIFTAPKERSSTRKAASERELVAGTVSGPPSALSAENLVFSLCMPKLPCHPATV